MQHGKRAKTAPLWNPGQARLFLRRFRQRFHVHPLDDHPHEVLHGRRGHLRRGGRHDHDARAADRRRDRRDDGPPVRQEPRRAGRRPIQAVDQAHVRAGGALLVSDVPGRHRRLAVRGEGALPARHLYSLELGLLYGHQHPLRLDGLGDLRRARRPAEPLDLSDDGRHARRRGDRRRAAADRL